MEIRTPQERKRKEPATALIQPERREQEPRRLEQLRNIVDAYWADIIREYKKPDSFPPRNNLGWAVALVLLFPERRNALGLESDALWTQGKTEFASTIEPAKYMQALASLVQLYPERRAELQALATELDAKQRIRDTEENLKTDINEAYTFLRLWIDFIILFPEERKNVPTQLIRDRIIEQSTIMDGLIDYDIAELNILLPHFDQGKFVTESWKTLIKEQGLANFFEDEKRGMMGQMSMGLEFAQALALLVADEVVIDESGVHLISSPIYESRPSLPTRSLV